MIQRKAASYSHMGARHNQNDDSAYVNDSEGLYIICDGVSEGGQGKLAASLVTQIVLEKLSAANRELNLNTNLFGTKRLLAMQEAMANAFAEAQTQLKVQAVNNPLYKSASTTCITLWFNGRFAIMAHLGDSRAYLYRAGKLYQLTKDHSGLDELLKLGMTPEAAMKNPLSRSLTRAFGNSQFNQPDILKIEFEPNDTLFLCTDGVYTTLNSPQAMTGFVQDLLQENEIKPWIEKCAKTSGDDSTLISIRFEPEETTVGAENTTYGVHASERIHLVGQTPLSKYLDYSQKTHIAAICEISPVKKGDVIAKEGNEGDCMYLIAKGIIQVQSKGRVIKELKGGQFAGEIALVQKTPRTASLVAKEDSVLLTLKRNHLEEIFRKDPLLEMRFYKAMLETVLDRVVEMTEQVASASKG